MPPRSDLLVWIDLEMTGLDSDRCHILEIATIVTTNTLETVAEGPNLVINQGPEELETLSDWSRDQFTRSGLLERVRQSPTSNADAERLTLEFLRPLVEPRKAPLCGNSVHNDRAFLVRRMPTLNEHLHYRNVDVSTVKELVRRWYPGKVQAPAKADSHQALADIRESIDELRYYRRVFFIPT